MKIYINQQWCGGYRAVPDGWCWTIADADGYTAVAGWRRFKTAAGCRKEADRVLEALKKTKGKYT